MPPLDLKTRPATLIDKLALRALILLLCVLYFFKLFESSPASLIAGGALFILVLLTGMLIQKRTLSHRERALRERIGGMIALEEILLMPFAEACEKVCALLCAALDAKQAQSDQMYYEGEAWLIRCAQCTQGSVAGEGEVLNAHRARTQSGADQCALVSTGGFSPAATRMAEWMEPPIRLIPGRQLAFIAGKLHPATDEEIARHARRQKTPFSWRRIRALALSPAKLVRHLLCAFLLLLLYLATGSGFALFACLFSFVLAMLCDRVNKRRFLL